MILFPLRPGPLAPGVGILDGWAITSYFGGRIDPLTGRAGNHGGMDFAFSGCQGQEMIAVVDGTLAQFWDNSGGGNWSGLTGADGSYYGYGHAAAYAFPGGGVRQVKAGDVIAYVGTTGGSTGPHLHFAYRKPGAFLYSDPYDLLVGASTSGVPAAPNTTPIEEDDMLTKEDVKAAVKEALDARPAGAPPAAHQVVQLNGQLWLVVEDGGTFRRRYITGPAELAMLQQIGVAYSGPLVNITPETEVAFLGLPEAVA